MLVSERQPKRRKILGLGAAAPAIYFRIFLFFYLVALSGRPFSSSFGCCCRSNQFPQRIAAAAGRLHIPIFVFGQTGSQCAREEENVRRSRASSVGDQHPILW